MNALDHFLREHAAVHREAVERSEFNMDYLLEGLVERQLRLRPHGMNSLAWIFWHIARTEDGFVSCIVLGREQLFDQDWKNRLRVAARGTSTGKDGVGELSEGIDLDALWAYRDAVGRRTRESVRTLWHENKWDSPIEVADVRKAVSAGVASPHFEKWLPGKPRESALYWWGLHHTLMHLGQVGMLRGVISVL